MVNDLINHPPLGESDHLCLTFSVEYNQCDTPFSPSRNVYKADYNKIREELKHYNWSELLSGSFESDYDFCPGILYSIIDIHTPMSTPTQRGKSVYMTKEAIRLIMAKSNYNCNT